MEKNKLQYEHLKVKYKKDRYAFEQVVKTANKNKLELSDKDIERFIKLYRMNINIEWIMKWLEGDLDNLSDVLISYMNF